MITFGRISIWIGLALLTGCASCPPPGQPTGTRIGPDPSWSWLQDKSTCDCHYLFLIPDPASDVQRVDDHTSIVRAMVPPAPTDLAHPNPRAINTRYSFLVNSSESSLEALATSAGEYGLKFEGCRVPDANADEGEEFVLNAKPNDFKKALIKKK
ncbi:MAG TPA: hypothetical protein VEG60_15265 [Candidatus Binatia bacterium]|nr:hypothetical protein [Candidatus Binatia bacterium]